jgi:hypothetical protein
MFCRFTVLIGICTRHTGTPLDELINNYTYEVAEIRTNSSNMIGYQLDKFILKNTQSRDLVNVAK